MAEQDDLQANQNEPTLALPGDEKPEQEGSKKILLIIIAAVTVLILTIAAILAYVLLAEEDTVAILGTAEEAEYMAEYTRRMQNNLEPVTKPLFTESYSYTVNMKNGRNYVHLSIKAVLQDPMAILFLEARTPIIDDKIITLLKSKFPEELKTRAGIELLKQAILIEFNQLFPQEYIEQSESKDRNPVKEILVSEFYIQ